MSPKPGDVAQTPNGYQGPIFSIEGSSAQVYIDGLGMQTFDIADLTLVNLPESKMDADSLGCAIAALSIKHKVGLRAMAWNWSRIRHIVFKRF